MSDLRMPFGIHTHLIHLYVLYLVFMEHTAAGFTWDQQTRLFLSCGLIIWQKTNSFCPLIRNTVRHNLHDKTVLNCGCIMRGLSVSEITDCPSFKEERKGFGPYGQNPPPFFCLYLRSQMNLCWESDDGFVCFWRIQWLEHVMEKKGASWHGVQN